MSEELRYQEGSISEDAPKDEQVVKLSFKDACKQLEGTDAFKDLMVKLLK